MQNQSVFSSGIVMVTSHVKSNQGLLIIMFNQILIGSVNLYIHLNFKILCIGMVHVCVYIYIIYIYIYMRGVKNGVFV